MTWTQASINWSNNFKMKLRPIVIHVGLTKAASTFLQAAFSVHPDIYYPERVDSVHEFCGHELNFELLKAKSYVNNQLGIASGRRLILSHERLSGNPHSGFYDCASIARRLAVTMPDAQIVIAIREQFAIIASCYKQYVRIGGTKTISEYIFPVQDYRIPRFDWSFFRYLNLIRLYQNLFGVQNVFIMPVDDLHNSCQCLMDGLFKFIGVQPLPITNQKVNEGVADADIDMLRRRNLISPPNSSLHDFFMPKLESESNLPELKPNETTAFVMQARNLIGSNSFSESNKVLSSLLGVDLSSLGYS